MSQCELKLKTLVSQPFAENTYLAYLAGCKECLIIDPGMEPEVFLSPMQSESLVPAAILNTHGHADHIAGNGAVKDRWPDCPLVIGELEAPKLTDANLNLSAPFGLATTSPKADILVHDGQTIDYAGIELLVLHVPGHSSGHVVYVCKQTRPWRVFCGDVLFRGGIGRTDFPDGSFPQLSEGIHTKLFTMPDDTIVLSGHGPETTIGEEKRTNPFVGKPAGYEG